MKKIIVTTILFTIYGNTENIVNQEQLLGAMINSIKKIPESIANVGKTIYNEEIKNEKNYWWYYWESNKLTKKLKNKKIDYHTILKQGMYPTPVYSNTKQAWIKKYAILKALAKENGINTEPIKETKKEKKKLNIVISEKN